MCLVACASEPCTLNPHSRTLFCVYDVSTQCRFEGVGVSFRLQVWLWFEVDEHRFGFNIVRSREGWVLPRIRETCEELSPVLRYILLPVEQTLLNWQKDIDSRQILHQKNFLPPARLSLTDAHMTHTSCRGRVYTISKLWARVLPAGRAANNRASRHLEIEIMVGDPSLRSLETGNWFAGC